MKQSINKLCGSLLLFLLSTAINFSIAQEPFFQFGYGYSLGKVNNLNQIIYMHNLRNDTEKEMRFINGGHGFTIGGGLEEDIGIEFKWSNVHASRSSTFQAGDTLFRQDLRVRRNGLDINFYGNFDGKVNIGAGTDFSLIRARSRKYPDEKDAIEYIEFLKTDGKLFSGFSGGLSVFGTYNINSFLGVRATYRWSIFNGVLSKGLSSYMNAGAWSTVPDAAFTPRLKWSTFKIEVLITLGGDR